VGMAFTFSFVGILCQSNQSSFKKEAPCIAKDLGPEDEQIGNVGGGDGVGHMGVGDCLSCQAGAVEDLRGRPPLAPLTLAA
jgi:hypothetical protein